MYKSFQKYKLQYGGIEPTSYDTNSIQTITSDSESIKCSYGFIKDNILNDCIKYDFGDNGITEKRNEIAELKDIAAKKIISNVLDGFTPYNNLTTDELNAYLCLTGNIMIQMVYYYKVMAMKLMKHVKISV